MYINPLAPNDVYIRRTAQPTSRRCNLNIYSTNILTEYFKHAAHSSFFSLQNAVYFIMLSFLVSVIFTFYIQDVLKFYIIFRCKGLIDDILIYSLFSDTTHKEIKYMDIITKDKWIYSVS